MDYAVRMKALHALPALLTVLLSHPAPAAGRLDRGAVAIETPEGCFVSWRLLPEDPQGTGFNVYRRSAGALARLNGYPLRRGTCFLDRDRTRDAAKPADGYVVRPVVGGKEGEPAEAVRRKDGARLPYLSIPLRPLPGYTANDGSAADLDGDGSLEIIVHRTGRGRDNSQSGITDPPVLEAYRLDGKFLWHIDLGRNIREGAHYTQFLAYDFDGDGRAEVACRTADGTVDGRGRAIGDARADHRNADGYVLKGPEFLTVFDGRTGAALATTPYLPPRHPSTPDPTPAQLEAVWGDGYGNRSDRFLAGVAYLDGKRPSLVFSRGYYTRTVIAAWDFREGRLQSRWVFDSAEGSPEYAGQGNHGLFVADVDSDGRDEIVFGSCTIDDDGSGLYSTGLGHGDALHVSDLDPRRPGLEVFAIHERPRGGLGVTFRDARTGRVLWSRRSSDVGRGVAIDIDPRYPGTECWASTSEGQPVLWSATGEEIARVKPRACNFAAWWDADPLREILDGTTITKWDWRAGREEKLLEAEGCLSNNGTKATPVLSGDILGDWREEVVWRSADDTELRVYTTTIPTTHRLPSLMADWQYRLAVAWQNVGYNQPPHPSFDLATRLESMSRTENVRSLLALRAGLSPDRPRLWIIGDSTVRNGSGRGENGQWGWGDRIEPFFDPGRIEVVNRAIGGRSSRTFLTDGRWDAMLDEARPGDFLILQFGHNDPGPVNDDSRARGTLPGIGEEFQEIENLLTRKPETVHTFGWYLRRYLRDAKAAGLLPIVCSYVPRCPRPDAPWPVVAEPGSYRLWAQQAAEQEGAGYIDLFGLVSTVYATLAPEQIKGRYFCDSDFTHTNLAGAELNASKVAEGIRLLDDHPLRRYLKDPTP